MQARFVDEPEAAVREADALVQRVMSDRGYPVADDFERRAADVSVDYPDVVENFREGHPSRGRERHGVAPPGDGALPVALRGTARGRPRP